jgi:3-hydroxymyristoyl/3-hydroxydecanoyl-(acyl carrier protein) dehydratase
MKHLWTVPADLPALAGHFPGRPIVPGVVLLDRVLLLASKGTGRASGWRIDNAKFFRPVGPGTTLAFELSTRPSGALAFTVCDGEHEVASGTLG